MISPQTSGVDCPAGQLLPVAPGQGPAPVRDTDPRLKSKKIYGSFIPLQQSDVLRHLKRTFNKEKKLCFNASPFVITTFVQKPVPSFQVVYKKHTLTLDDLLTLADQNWLNDQIMNMYGELIVESSSHKVHFLNSFFHRQLMTKGYDGVKRWTKQVDLFSKSLLLVPIHLEVHWCLVTADLVKKKICLYDSQGNALQKVARYRLEAPPAENLPRCKLNYIMSCLLCCPTQKIPQQSNENDCGVFVLEYCRCLALAKPFQFSQEDIPKIRKRIYKELCDCKLHEES
uniref:Ubiquitin-like protease family profile domain-containing protein n=1 Tax=Echeneis naucrates TaxID=173247 RepID=A0A665TBX5_ECHNA